MYGVYHHFKKLRFNTSHALSVFKQVVKLCLFSSEVLECRLLNLLVDRPVNVGFAEVLNGVQRSLAFVPMLCVMMIAASPRPIQQCSTASLRTEILDFRGFDSGRILNSRGGILMSIGDFPEMLSQQIYVGIILVGRLGLVVAGQPRNRGDA